MTNIEKIDYAASMTMQRWQSNFQDRTDMNLRNIEDAFLKVLVDNNYQSITRQNGARDLLQEVSLIEFQAELLKYLIKMVSYKQSIDDPSIGKGTAVQPCNVSDNSFPIYFVENGLYNEIYDCAIYPSSDNQAYAPGQIGFEYLSQNINILKYVVQSFVQNRYGNHLDNVLESFADQNPYVKNIIDEIDIYSLRYEHILSDGIHR